jgi:hypothetical protein
MGHLHTRGVGGDTHHGGGGGVGAGAENLNKAIAWRWKNAGPEEREIFRLMLGCVGRGGSGGDGQVEEPPTRPPIHPPTPVLSQRA